LLFPLQQPVIAHDSDAARLLAGGSVCFDFVRMCRCRSGRFRPRAKPGLKDSHLTMLPFATMSRSASVDRVVFARIA